MRLTFLGGAGCVTGSRTLVEHGGQSVLVDCGLFQGYKELRLLNWKRFPVKPARIEAVVLTHAHLDHSGWLPRLRREGFRGPVLATPATCDLVHILLEDAARVQEADAKAANRGGYSKHHPARPLYTVEEADAVLRALVPVPAGRWRQLGNVSVRFTPNGHILGSSMVEVRGDETVLWSGDLGRGDDLVMPPPQPAPACDRLVLESTYGNRRHQPEDSVRVVADCLRRAQERHGVLVVPSFAVGRAQTVLLLLHLARQKGVDMPVYLDSPMASKAMQVMSKHLDLTRLEPSLWRTVTRGTRIIPDQAASEALHKHKPPFVVVSSSGMATGGRVLGHLKAFAPSNRNTVLLTGHQAGGTRGAQLLAGAKELRMHGQMVPVRAAVRRLENVSAHADQAGLVAWATAPHMPARIHLLHGEAEAANALRQELRHAGAPSVHIPRMGERA